MLKISQVKQIAEDEYGVYLGEDVTQFDVEQAVATIYDILGLRYSDGCSYGTLKHAVVFHIINKNENNPEKDARALKLELASYLRAHGHFPGVKY